MEKELSKKFYQSYLYSQFGIFFISTAYRRSSAIDLGWYYETFAWEIDKDNKREGGIIADNSGALTEEGAIRQHNQVVEQLLLKGQFESIK
jgi:hypothetical protein